MVAAMIVGRITVTGIATRDVPFGTHPLDIDLGRGDELGIFHLGSTAVLFLEPGVAAFERGLGPIQVGETLIDASIAPGDGDG
jgi:phosphatidylserine decarboxylase